MNAVIQVVRERIRQRRKWGQQNHADGTGLQGDRQACSLARAWCDREHQAGRGTWRHILEEEVAEAFAESDPQLLRAELVQVAAVAVAWVEAIDRRNG